MNKDKYIGVFISDATTPQITYRISTSKGWCTRHINEECIAWVNCKCSGSIWRKVCKLSELHLYAVMTHEREYSRFEIFVKNRIMDLLNELES